VNDIGEQRYPDVVVQGLVVNGDAVLMIRRGSEPYRGSWSFPGGRLEARESLENAVRREVFEETGVEVEPTGLIGIYESLTTARHFIIAGYTASVAGRSIPNAGDDADEAAWVALDKVSALDLSPEVGYFFDLYGLRD
jgi:8-oxo-dGTP diphosphatase